MGESTRIGLRRAVGAMVAAAMVAAAVLTAWQPAPATASAVAANPANDRAEIKPRLQAQLESRGAANFWVRFDAQADLSAASRTDDWVERGEAVAETLRRVAETSQADVRAELDAAAADYTAYWVTNAIYVRHGSQELATALAAEPEVAALHPTRTYAIPELSPDDAAVRTAATVEWGIANINADEVWSQYDVTGTGIVVANIDTGVQYDHPALARQYRGNNGDGTFTHDYNWFDASGTCAGAPCDRNGHGTHTMGTMAGDDGMGNQIGVAPGVTWMAANGCATCTDADLIASGQWMLQPTDLTGGNPDAAMRPNIINNSWGSGVPSNDPFMQDVTDAWAASGIFGVWSNGNIGPTCDTSGSPGSRIGNYSVGAYEASNTIASFSSRGTGQDGETKPNLSAPGVDVRSSIHGSRYATASGTSMAAPHVAGAVALLWSAAPGLVGDVAGTRALLDGSSIDTPDDQCGGTDQDNNVYGEGRLDALALVDSAPVQDTGTLTVTAVDARTGDPVNGARISLTGPVTRERVTGADGVYSLALPVGDYQVSASAFGYADLTATATVRGDDTTELRLDMRATPRVRLSGRVVDGSGQGWPLYAKVTLQGVPGGTTYTRPSDGRYSFSVPAEAAYTMTVDAQYPGYEVVTNEVSVGKEDLTRNLQAPAVLEPCRTSGYAYRYDGAGTDFDAGLPDGWTVTDNNGSGTTWQFDDEFENVLGETVGNQTGGVGGFAMGRSPGNSVFIDTTLTTPVLDLTGVDEPVIGFRQHFTRVTEFADVELSLNGGATWQTVRRQDRSVRGPIETTVPIPQAANQPQAQVRFHYFPARFNTAMWQLDDVYVGRRTCEPVAGGLVVGHVRDANTGAAVNGAAVRSDSGSGRATTSAATPLDPAVGDGFYSMFVPEPGKHRLTARAHEFTAKSRLVRVEPGEAEAETFSLAAGRLRVDPGSVTESVRVGRSESRKFTLRNTGTAPVTVRLSERFGPVGDAGVDGPGVPGLSADGAEVVRIEGDFSPLAFGASGSAPASRAGPDDSRVPEAPESPWTELGEYPTRIMDNAVAEHGGKVYSVGGVDGDVITDAAYVYEHATREWASIAPLPEGRESPAGAFIDGKLYVATGWSASTGRATQSMYVYDPQSDGWTTGADAPVGTAAAGRAVLDGKLYLVGGCTNACGEDTVQRYDPATDSWERLADYPEGRGHLACGPLDGQLYCAGGIARTSTQTSDSTYAYDPATNTWTQKADLPVDLWGMGYTSSYDQLLVSGGVADRAITNQGWIYDPHTDSWAGLPASSHVLFRGGSTCGLHRIGGSVRSGFVPANSTELLPTYGACGSEDVPWMSLDRRSLTLAPGKSVKVTMRLDAESIEPGTHEATVWVKEDTPYLIAPIAVTMRATS